MFNQYQEVGKWQSLTKSRFLSISRFSKGYSAFGMMNAGVLPLAQRQVFRSWRVTFYVRGLVDMKQTKSNAVPGVQEQNKLGVTGMSCRGDERTSAQKAVDNTSATPPDNRQPEENKPCR